MEEKYMEERSLRVYQQKTFFSKLGTTLSKILVPTRVGFNSIMISVKRNNLLKSYEAFLTYDGEDKEKKEALNKKYEDTFVLYLESIDKYVMDSVYKKVKNGSATQFEEEALSKYYVVTHLKETQYMEYKYRKQKYLLDLDYETVKGLKEKVKNRYINFYINKMDTLYKGILKNYSIQLADNLKTSANDKNEIYDKVFDTVEEYIVNILDLKLKKENSKISKEILEEYGKYEKFLAGKFDSIDILEKKMITLGISRKIFTHSLPLTVAEQCYQKLLNDARSLVQDTKIATRREKAYNLLINLIEEYSIKLLSTKVYWDNAEEREEFKSFWNSYKEVCKLKEVDFIEYVKQKEVLFIKDDMKKIKNVKYDYSKLIKYYKRKLVDYGAMKEIQGYKSQGNYKRTKTYFRQSRK